MSSSRLNFNRKRRSDYETSDSDSEDEYTPVRKLRKCHRETNIKQTFASKCRNLWQWISDLPLKDYFKETMYKKSLIYPQTADLVVIDEDDDDSVIPVEEDEEDEDDIVIIHTGKERSPSHSSKYKDKRKDSFLKSLSTDNILSLPPKHKSRHLLSDLGSIQRPYNGSIPLASSTPFYRDTRPVMDVSYINPSCEQVNGFHDKNWDDHNDCKEESIATLQKLNSKRRVSPITNPGVDVEILLGDNATAGEDSDDLEIISEVSNNVSQCASFPRVKTVYRLNQIPRDRETVSQDVRVNGNACSKLRTERDQPSVTSYTAHEVVRLQEKAQYKLLLDKLVKESVYRPVVPRSGSRCAEIQVDLTEDDDDEPVMQSHFKREISKLPVQDFLKKYYKPCRLITPPQQDTSSHLHLAAEASRNDDDDIQVVETKPLPHYSCRYKQRSDFFSPDWIEELKMTISSETEKRLHIVAEQEQKIERYRNRRDAKLAEENRLRDELMNVMLPCVADEREDEFPALTDEIEKLIDAAWEIGDSSQVLSSMDRLDITRSDVATLNGLNWLNDSVINFYLQLIVERSKLDNFPSVYAFSSFFFTSLKTRGENNVLRWTRKVDIFSYDILLVPLHLGKGMHWALGVIDNRIKKVRYYDSMRSHDDSCLYLLQKYLVVEMKDKKKIDMDLNTYSIETVKDIPQQMNGSDCGMFSLKYAEYISRDAPITFTQEHMWYFRRKMVYELLVKQLA